MQSCHCPHQQTLRLPKLSSISAALQPCRDTIYRRTAAVLPFTCTALPMRAGSQWGWVAQPTRQQRRPQHAAEALPSAAATAQPQQLLELADGLETPIQLIYLLTLLGFLVIGAYLVVRQVLIRRDLEEAAKVLGDRVRSGSEDSEDLFELGVILLRKKLYTQACRHLEKAKKQWGGDPEELAQVHNALGYAYFNMGKTDIAIGEYKQAVDKQPGYVTALNNLGDAYEKAQQQKDALSTYEEVLNYAPGNKVASSRVDALRQRV